MNVTMIIESDDTYSEAHAAAVQQALQQQLASQRNNAPIDAHPCIYSQLVLPCRRVV